MKIKIIKDKMVSVRINSEIKKALEEKGLTVQKILDERIEELFKLEHNLLSSSNVTKKEAA